MLIEEAFYWEVAIQFLNGDASAVKIIDSAQQHRP